MSKRCGLCGSGDVDRRTLYGGDGPDEAAESWKCAACGAYAWLYCDGTLSEWKPKMKEERKMGSHIVNGQFQSDKYPTCPPGKVPLSVKDVMAQDLLWEYAQRRRAVDAEFADDLEIALVAAGFPRRETVCFGCQPNASGTVTTPLIRIPVCVRCGKPCTAGHWVQDVR